MKILCALVLVMAGDLANAAIVPADLRCESRVAPLGIEQPSPQLSWVLTSKERNQTQSAYQILAASNQAKLKQNAPDLWDSGRIVSNDTMRIAYGGQPL